MNRLEFLKSVGFKGPALVALLTSCVSQEDTVVNALTLQQDVADEPSTTLPDTTTSGELKLNSATAISTDALNMITGVKLKIDLTQSENAALLVVKGYLVRSGIVVAQSAAGVIVAATQTCSHEPKNKVIFNKTEFYCTEHGARYSLAGAGLNNYGANGLTIYKTATDGNTIVIY